MKQKSKLTALLLALCLLLSLAACGDKNKGNQLSGTVYVPEFMDVQMDNIDYIGNGCASGDYVFFSADVRGEQKTETWTDPETGETETYEYYESRNGIFRLSLTGGAVEELADYALPDIPEGSEGNVYLNSIQAGEDNTIWVTEGMTIFTYDYPEGFDPEANPDDKWEYQSDYKDSIIRRQLDETGKELNRIDLTDLEEKAGTEYIGNAAFDQAGNIYIIAESKLVVLDTSLSQLCSLDLEADSWGNLVQLGDGNMGLLYQYSDTENETYGFRMKAVDLQNKAWGTAMELSQNAYSAITGGGDYLFYYQNNDSIYGWKKGASEGEKLFSWLNTGLNRNDISFFCFLNDGRVAVMTQTWDNEGNVGGELTMLTPTDAKSLPEKTTLTMAAMWLSYDTKNKIMEFNKKSDTCRIEVVDYSEFNTGSDSSAGLTKLNTEIAAGNVPDLFYTQNLPISRYAAKGILEDLWPLIEADTEIGGRQALMEHVLDTASTDGKLYQIFSSFRIQSVVGPASVVGDRMSWTLTDLQNALEQMPDGCMIFGEDDIKEYVLTEVISMNQDQFVDWETGKCSFDSDSFKALLEFCNSFPAEYNWEEHQDDEYESPYARIMSGKQMLANAYFYDFTRGQFFDQLFNGGYSYIGFPKEDGSVGSCFTIDSNSYAMSTTCKDKDAAWSFIRELLLPQADNPDNQDGSGRYYFSGFPVNKSDFEKYRDSQMTEIYELDENGQPVLDENGEPIRQLFDSWYVTDDFRIECYAATQENVDKIMALYDAIDSISGYDESIYQIIQETTGAYFAGDRDVDYTASQIQNKVQLYMGENM